MAGSTQGKNSDVHFQIENGDVRLTWEQSRSTGQIHDSSFSNECLEAPRQL
eukprot:Pgem_evm1s12294